ncbi:MAG: hypothetical protein Ct9H300mP1_14890 [Planctomycetaceae bacterium]|nr:MAG: hypothetical protein Ct9H300mP1_14890 [Planctomycetaceae bacterium]
MVWAKIVAGNPHPPCRRNRDTMSLGGWMRRTLGNRNVQLGLLMCLAAVVAMLIVVEGWKPLKPGGSVTGPRRAK